MKPTQLMIDAAYEAALVTTAGELARNGGSVNYRVVIEAALTEALAIMPTPEAPAPAPVVPEVAYSISRTGDGEAWGGLFGPYPKLSTALSQTGQDDGCYIVKHNVDGTIVPLYRWNDDLTKWERY